MASGGSVCAAMFCHNYRKKTPNISYFRFPKDPKRCKAWILFSERKDLVHKTPEQLYKSVYICSEHFQEECFMNISRKKLVWDAVPSLKMNRELSSEVQLLDSPDISHTEDMEVSLISTLNEKTDITVEPDTIKDLCANNQLSVTSNNNNNFPINELVDEPISEKAFNKGVQSIKSTVTPLKEKLAENSNKTYSASIVNNAEYEMKYKKPVKQSNNKADDVTIKYLNASKLKCCECDHPITFNHFGRFLRCGSCHYSTNCCKAFVDHMILKHSRLNRKRKHKGIDPKPTTLKKPMSCECGFTSLDGNSIAAHLVYCRKPSCQITSAKSMITVITQAEDGYWHVYKSKGRKSHCSVIKAKQNKNLKLSKSKQKIKNNRKQKIQTKSKQNNIKINGIIYAPLKIRRNDDKEIKSANKVDFEEKETEESLNMLNALGLIYRSKSAVADSFNGLKDITDDDDKLDSLYYKAEEINELLNSCE